MSIKKRISLSDEDFTKLIALSDNSSTNVNENAINGLKLLFKEVLELKEERTKLKEENTSLNNKKIVLGEKEEKQLQILIAFSDKDKQFFITSAINHYYLSKREEIKDGV